MTDRQSFRDRVLTPKSSVAETAWVLALISLASCGVFSPLALIVSVVALFGPDRRIALRALLVSLASAGVLVGAVALLAQRR